MQLVILFFYFFSNQAIYFLKNQKQQNLYWRDLKVSDRTSKQKNGRPHRAASIPTYLCEECRIPVLILFEAFVSLKTA